MGGQRTGGRATAGKTTRAGTTEAKTTEAKTTEGAANRGAGARREPMGRGADGFGRGGERLRPTMTDVAQAAQVSLKTVSRVVNGERNVSSVMALGVQNAIKDLGYRRNEHARALRQHRGSRMLGLVTKDVSNPFYSAIARGVEEEVRDRGLLVVAGSSGEDGRRERELLEILCERRVGGLLVVPTGDDHAFLASELAHGTPVVFIDRPPQNLAADTILLDNVRGARAAVDHLIAHGHERIGLLGDLAKVFTTAERVKGYREALRVARLAADEALVRLGCHDTAAAQTAAEELLALPSPPTAFFACNNRITFGALRAFAGAFTSVAATPVATTSAALTTGAPAGTTVAGQRGQSSGRPKAADPPRRRSPPALVGFDDFELAPFLSPPVTVVAYDPVDLGRRAARLICERLDGAGGPPRRLVVGTEIVARGSGEMRPRCEGRRPAPAPVRVPLRARALSGP